MRSRYYPFVKSSTVSDTNPSQITQVDPDSTSNEVGSRSVLEFALHVERLRDLKHMLNLKSRGHHAHMTEMDSGENVPATNIWVARVVGLERQPSS